MFRHYVANLYKFFFCRNNVFKTHRSENVSGFLTLTKIIINLVKICREVKFSKWKIYNARLVEVHFECVANTEDVTNTTCMLLCSTV